MVSSHINLQVNYLRRKNALIELAIRANLTRCVKLKFLFFRAAKNAGFYRRVTTLI